jgi:hypothetical protein
MPSGTRGSSQRLTVEFNAAEPCPVAFGGDPDIVLYFASWAFSVRYGAAHELAEAAKRLERRHGVALRPLLRYADRDVEDEADRREFERVWQDATPLAETCRAVAAAIASGDEALDTLLSDYPDLAPRLLDLAAMCDWAAARGARVRLSYQIEQTQPTAPRPGPQAHGVLRGPPAGPPGGPRSAL